MRELKELIDVDEPAMALIHEWISEGSRPVEILAAEPKRAAHDLLALQVTTRSALGALAYETGGILVDHGWLRLLGSASAKLPRGIVDWNRMAQPDMRVTGALLVGDDAVGGFFAINAGAFEGPSGNVFYLAPDTCEWEDLDIGHTDWVSWAITGDVAEFYADLRWPGWQAEAARLRGDQCVSIVPLLWTEGPPIEQRSRRAVPVEETWDLHAIEFPRQLGSAD